MQYTNRVTIRFQDFTETAQEIARQTTALAARYGQTLIDLEHITLALLETPDADLLGLFQALALDVETLQQKTATLVASLGRDNVFAAPRDPENLSITPRVKTVIEQAQLEADRLGDRYIRTAHLFWAVAYLYAGSEQRTEVGRLFRTSGITPTRVHEWLLKRLQG